MENILNMIDMICDMIYDMNSEIATFCDHDILSAIYRLDLSFFKDSMYYDVLNEYLSCAKAYAWNECYEACEIALDDLYNAILSIA